MEFVERPYHGGRHMGKHHYGKFGKHRHGKNLLKKMSFGGDLECGPHMDRRHMGKHSKHLNRMLAFEKDIESKKDLNTFKLILDVQNFEHEGISVSANENTVTVKGKHDEKEVSNGTIARSFIRKINVPEEFDMSKLASKYLPNGFMVITAPKIGAEITTGVRDIPIIRNEDVDVTDMLQSQLSM